MLLHGALAGDWHGRRMPRCTSCWIRTPQLHALLPRLSRRSRSRSRRATGASAGHRRRPGAAVPDARVVRVPVMRRTAPCPRSRDRARSRVGDPPIAPYHDLRAPAQPPVESGARPHPPSADAAARAAREESLAQPSGRVRTPTARSTPPPCWTPLDPTRCT
ncbi:hypothetical protein QJS66_21085 [Kocuria rhizophila]|nr:hypothetical protein QJS66_21085 [Kocuria rhizophila]